MPTYQDDCPLCDGQKDARARACKRCFMTKIKPRLGTANDLFNLELMSRSEHARLHINLTPEKAKSMSVLGHKARWGYEPSV